MTQHLEAQQHVSALGKDYILSSLKAAANPDAQAIDVAVAQLPEARRKQVQQAASAMRKATKAVTARAKAALLEMSDDEWQRLIDEAENGT